MPFATLKDIKINQNGISINLTDVMLSREEIERLIALAGNTIEFNVKEAGEDD